MKWSQRYILQKPNILLFQWYDQYKKNLIQTILKYMKSPEKKYSYLLYELCDDQKIWNMSK